jgi:hypothetical protein
MQQPPSGPYEPYNSEPTRRVGSAPQRAAKPARMPKARSLEVIHRFKTALIAGSVMAFGVLTALVAGHTTGVTARAASSGSSGSSATPATAAPTRTPSDDDSGGFFNSAPSNSSNGGFGVSSSAPSQAPVTGSNVS